MSIFSLLVLFFIIYLCGKAIGSIWRDAFGTIDGSTKTQRPKSHTRQQTQTSASASQADDKPIKKGEGEYVDYEEF